MTPAAVSQQSQSNIAKALTEVQPPLRNALSSLNINLDYELARYRYAKRGEVQPSVKPPQFQPRRRSLNLINVPPQSSRPASTQSPAGTPPPPPPNPRIQNQTANAHVAVPPTVGANPIGATTGQPMSEVAALRSAIVHQPTASSGTYLASSAALLENFEPPAAGYRSEPTMEPPSEGWFTNWNTPLGLGALMLLLVASAGFGFLLVNPTVAQNLFRDTPLARFWASPLDEETAATPDELSLEESEATADFDGPPLNSLSPDLSQREFSDLDLNNLSNLPSGGDRAVNRAPAVGVEDPEAADAESDRPAREASRATNPNPSVREPQEVNEIPRTTTPAPRPQPTTPTDTQPYRAPAPAPPPAAASPETVTQPAPPAATETAPINREPISSYYVVTDYTGDPSLESVREVVEDAYVRNFEDGARIQLGAFNTEEGAAALVEELQSQGVEVRIYEP